MEGVVIGDVSLHKDTNYIVMLTGGQSQNVKCNNYRGLKLFNCLHSLGSYQQFLWYIPNEEECKIKYGKICKSQD